nr:MAG TPA: hypothetical protein [Caudoviricetes sp.]
MRSAAIPRRRISTKRNFAHSSRLMVAGLPSLPNTPV